MIPVILLTSKNQGTIVSLMAITSMLLPSLSNVHWLASAFWVFSIVSGLLSVHYACNLQSVIGTYLHEKDFTTWISTRCSRTPSFSSVLIISSSKVLLDFALITYIVGLGIYLGFVWKVNLDVHTNQDDSRNIFIVFLICFIVCYGIYSISSFKNPCEHGCWKANWAEIVQGLGKKADNEAVGKAGSKEVGEALILTITEKD